MASQDRPAGPTIASFSDVNLWHHDLRRL